jgi:hypothetical protein
LLINISLYWKYRIASGSKQCDNDPATSGCAAGVGTGGTWTYLKNSTTSTAYSNDIRYNGSSIPAQYYWILDTGLTTITALNLYVNLYSNQATCIEADYVTQTSYIGSLDQSLASTGSFANYIGYTTGAYSVSVAVNRGSNVGNLVADAVKLSW